MVKLSSFLIQISINLQNNHEINTESKRSRGWYIDLEKYIVGKIDKAEWWEGQNYRTPSSFCNIGLNQERQVGLLLLVL